MASKKKLVWSLVILLSLGLLVAVVIHFSPEKRKRRYVHRGNIYFKKDKFTEAIQEYKQALEIAPKEVAIRVKLASSYLHSQQQPKAIAELKKCLEQGTEERSPFLMLAAIYTDNKEYAKAQQICEQFLQEHPQDPEILQQKGVVLHKIGRKQEAEDTLRQVIELAPDQQAAHLSLAALYWEDDKPDQAKAVLEKYLKEFPDNYPVRLQLSLFLIKSKQQAKAEKNLMYLYEHHPEKLPDYAHYLTLSLLAAQKHQLAFQIARQALPLSTSKLTAHPVLFYVRGWQNLQQQKYQQAIADFEMAQRSNLALADLYYKTALAYYRKGEEFIAIKELKETLQKSPRHLDAYLLLTEILMKKRLWGEAEKHLQQALEHFPQEVTLYRLHAQIQMEKGNQQQALKIFQKISSLQPKSLEGQIGVALVQVEKGEYRKALEHIQQLLKQNPQDAYLHYLRAKSYLELGNFPAALNAAKKAEELNPDSLTTALLLAQLRLKQGDYELAALEYAKIHKIRPKDRIVCRDLSEIYIFLQEPDKALEVLTKGGYGDSQAPVFLEQRAKIRLLQKKYRQAIELLEQIPNKSPQVVALLGDIYMELDNQQQAVSSFLEASEKLQHPALALRLAVSHYLENNLTAAVASLAKLPEKNRNYATQSFLAFLYLKKGELSQAWEISEPLVKNNPQNWLLRLLRATIELERSHLAAAQQELSNIPSQYSSLQKSLQDMVSISQQQMSDLFPVLGACILWQIGHAPAALRNCEQALEVFNNNHFLLYLQAVLWIRLDKAQQAQEQLAEILQQSSLDKPLYLYRLLGQLYQQNQKYQKAKQLWEEAQKHYPQASFIYLSLALCYQQLEDPQKAAHCYRTLLQQHRQELSAEQQSQALLYLARFSIKQQQHAQALRYAKKAYQQNPQSVAAVDTLALAYFHNQKLKLAAKYATYAHNLAPNNPSVAYHLAAIYQQQQKWSEALKLLQKALSDSPDFPEAQAARQLLERLQQLAPDSDGVRGMNQKALTLLKVGHRQQAIATFKKATEQFPEDAQAYLYLARIFWDLDQKQQAFGWLEKYLESHPNHFATRFQKGLFLMKEKNNQAAEKEFAFLFEHYPKQRYQVGANLAIVLYAQDKIQEMIAVSIATLSDYPKDQVVHPVLVFGRALQFLQKQDYQRALQDLQVAQQAELDLPNISYYLAAAHIGLGNYDKAQETIAQMEASNPYYFLAQALLVRSWSREEKWQQAESYCQKLLQQHPNHPMLLNLQAQLARDQNNLEQAQQIWQKILEQHPQNLEALLSLCQLWQSQQQHKQVIIKLSELALTKDNAALAQILIESYLQTGQALEALEFSEQTSSPLRWQLKARIYHSRGQLEIAQHFYQKLHQQEPANRQLVLALLEIYLQRSEWSQAEELIKTWQGAAIADRFYLLASQVALGQHHYNQALAHLQPIASQMEAKLLQGKIYYRRHHYQQAIEAFKQVKSSSYPAIHIDLAVNYYLLGKNSQTVTALSAYHEHSPKDFFSLLWKAHLLHLEQPQKAQQLFTEMASLVPGSQRWLYQLVQGKNPNMEDMAGASAIKDWLAEATEGQRSKGVSALILQQMHYLHAAKALWQNHFPVSPATLWLQGQLLAQTHPEEQQQLYQKLQELPEIPFYLYQQVGDYWKGKDNSQAIEFYQKAVEKNNQQAALWLDLANCYFQEKKWALCHESLLRARQLAPNSFPVLFELGLLYQQQQQWQKARQATMQLKSMAENSQNTSWHQQATLQLAQIALEQGKPKQAQQMLEKLYRQSSQEIAVLVNLGRVYLQTQQLSQAQSLLERAYLLEMNNLQVAYYLGKLYVKQHKSKKAKNVWKEALDFTSESHFRSKIKQELAKL